MMDYLNITQMSIAEQYPVISYSNPPMHLLAPGTIIGTWAYSLPGKVRFILAANRELAPGVLPADVTRTWLRDVYNLPIRRRKTQFNSHYVLPLHARKGKWGDCAYVDIKQAYLQVLKYGFDLEYVRGKYLAVDPVEIPAVIKDNKFCYSIAVAMANSKTSNIAIMGKEHIFEQTKFNVFSNPCLYAFACELLSSVASEVMALMGNFCYYINTDGFIVPAKYVYHLIDIIGSWGLHCAIKHVGDTEIFGVASWKVGDSQTSRYNPTAQNFTSVMPDKSERLWLKQIFTKLQQKYDILLTE